MKYEKESCTCPYLLMMVDSTPRENDPAGLLLVRGLFSLEKLHQEMIVSNE
jgi:hypothetical protein